MLNANLFSNEQNWILDIHYIVFFKLWTSALSYANLFSIE